MSPPRTENSLYAKCLPITSLFPVRSRAVDKNKSIVKISRRISKRSHDVIVFPISSLTVSILKDCCIF